MCEHKKKKKEQNEHHKNYIKIVHCVGKKVLILVPWWPSESFPASLPLHPNNGTEPWKGSTIEQTH